MVEEKDEASAVRVGGANGLDFLVFLHFLESELAASGVDIVAFFAADGCANSGGEEGSAEKVDSVLGGAFVGKSFDFVVGDEVDLGLESFGVLGEEAGLLGAIVDACE